MMVRLFVYFLIILVFPLGSFAGINSVTQPSNGQQFTISGTGLGVKSTAPPIRWETCENYTTGNNLSDESGWWSYKTADCTIEAKTRGVSTKAIEAEISPTRTPVVWRNNVGFESTGIVYVNMWIWWDWGDLWPTATDAYQIKSLGLHPTVNDTTAEAGPGFGGSFFPWWYPADPAHPVISLYHYFDAFGTVSWPSYTMDTTGMWINLIVAYDMGTIGGTDGKFRAYILDSDGSYKANVGNGDNKDFWTASEDNEAYGYIDAIKLFNYIDLNANPTGSLTLYYDDIYIDNTWMRVEIGDNAVYANCTHREIQPALTWSDTGITGTFNQGSFKTGDKVYFFVIDENGIPSDGHPVTIGGETPPVTGMSSIKRCTLNNGALH